MHKSLVPGARRPGDAASCFQNPLPEGGLESKQRQGGVGAVAQAVKIFSPHTSNFLRSPTDGVPRMLFFTTSFFSYHLKPRRGREESDDDLSLEEKDEKCQCLSRDSNPR